MQYYERRNISNQPATTIGADIARHLQARQDLGKAVVVCDTPAILLSLVRKQWFHLSRHLQKQRASTLNPEEILRLTHTIMHMQRMDFVAKVPHTTSTSDVYFVRPDELVELPPYCYGLYLTVPTPSHSIAGLLQHAADGLLIVDYDTGLSPEPLALLPKNELEARVLREWQRVDGFLRQHDIHSVHFASQNPAQFGALDDALDTLLSYSHEFLQLASGFRQTIHLAQPLATITAEQQQIFTAVMRLAYRVQTLSPDSFNTYLLKTFGEKESYFLRDQGFGSPLAYFALPCTIDEQSEPA